MNTADFKSRLEAEKKTLEHELASVGKKNPASPGDYEAVGSEQGSEPDILDQAKVTQSYEENEGIERDLEARYDQVRAALARIEDGTYGKCSVCGEAIEADRLEANPAASTCKAHLN
jgi:RNA polymerase-binding transcription factor DksA